MRLSVFESFVKQNLNWFQGYNPETQAAVEQAERELDQVWPVTLKWLITRYGYWRATGMGGLPFVVATTKHFRPNFPAHWVVISRGNISGLLSDGQADFPASRGAGLVILVLDPEKPFDGQAVIVCDEQLQIRKRYSGFSQYVMSLQRKLSGAVQPVFESCLPSFHRAQSAILEAGKQGFDLEEFQLRVLETLLCCQLSLSRGLSGSSSTFSAENSLSETRENCPDPSSLKPVDCGQPLVPARDEASSFQNNFCVGSDGTDLETGVDCRRRTEQVEDASSRHSSQSQSFLASGVATEKDLVASLSKSAREWDGSPESLLVQVQQTIQSRRDLLHSQACSIPVLFLHPTSSNRVGFKIPAHLPEGQLLLIPVQQDHHTLPAWLDPVNNGLVSAQVVSLIRLSASGEVDVPATEGTALGESCTEPSLARSGLEVCFLVLWISPEQVEWVENACREQTGAVPAWFMSAGELFSQLAGKWQRMQQQFVREDSQPNWPGNERGQFVKKFSQEF